MRVSATVVGRCAAAMFAVSVLAPVGAQGQQLTPTFKSGSIPSEGNTGYLLNISADKKTGIIVFDALERSLQGIGAPLFATQVFSISVPLTGAEKGVKIGVFVMGAVAGLKGTDASVITTVNGRTSVMDFVKLAPPSSPNTDLVNADCSNFPLAQTADAARRKAGVKQPEASKKPASKVDAQAAVGFDYSFMQCILVDVPSTADLRLNVILALNRQNQDAGGYVNVAVIDFSIQGETKVAK
jgi:hypothetical protein